MRVSVSGSEFDRNVSLVTWGAKGAKTIIFSNTVGEVQDGAFANAVLRSAILNEGLETLGKHQSYCCNGVFSNTRLRRVTLPSTLRVLGSNAFERCVNLREAMFEKNSVLKKIGENAFRNCSRLKSICLPEGLESAGSECFLSSGLEKVTIQSTLRNIDPLTF